MSISTGQEPSLDVTTYLDNSIWLGEEDTLSGTVNIHVTGSKSRTNETYVQTDYKPDALSIYYDTGTGGNESDRDLALVRAAFNADTQTSANSYTFHGTGGYLYNSGNVGIGVEAPTEKLEVSGDMSCSADLHVGDDIFVGDKVGIGTTNPSAPLHVSRTVSNEIAVFHNTSTDTGTSDGLKIKCGPNANNPGAGIKYISFYSNSDKYLGAIIGGGDETIKYVGTFYDTSDIRLKKDIKDTRYGLDDVLKLEIVDYKMKGGGGDQIGVIAQQVEPIFPELVGKPFNEKEFYTVSYNKFGPLAIKAIQDQQKIIDNLQARLEALENKI
jgi:hypothetical protein